MIITRPLEPGAHFSFELSGKRGAALVTKYQTYREDTLLESAFERYTKRHYESWVTFARDKQYGDNVQPVLVSGFDMTKDFAMVAYSNESTSLESDLTIAVPMLGSASASLWGTWHTRGSAHTNYGPQECSPPLSMQDTDSHPSEFTGLRDQYNQCVFLRYYAMRSRMRMFPRVIRAAAGPHDLGSGEDDENDLPVLAAQSESVSDAEPIIGGGHEDISPDEGLDTVSNASDAESDVVVRNTPHVKFSSFSLVFGLTLVFRTKNIMSSMRLQHLFSR